MIKIFELKLLFVLLLIFQSVFAHSAEKQITLKDVEISAFNSFLNHWPLFEKAISVYWQSDKDFFSNCDLKKLSVNSINGFWKYDLEEAKKLIWDHPEVLSELSERGEELFAVNTKSPCQQGSSDKNISWFFISQSDGYKVFNDVILIID